MYCIILSKTFAHCIFQHQLVLTNSDLLHVCCYCIVINMMCSNMYLYLLKVRIVFYLTVAPNGGGLRQSSIGDVSLNLIYCSISQIFPNCLSTSLLCIQTDVNLTTITTRINCCYLHDLRLNKYHYTYPLYFSNYINITVMLSKRDKKLKLHINSDVATFISSSFIWH